jgi:hypothetical protein
MQVDVGGLTTPASASHYTTHTQTYTHSYIHTYIHTYIHSYTHTHIHAQPSIIHPSIQLSIIHPIIHPSIHPSIYPSIQPTTHPPAPHLPLRPPPPPPPAPTSSAVWTWCPPFSARSLPCRRASSVATHVITAIASTKVANGQIHRARRGPLCACQERGHVMS